MIGYPAEFARSIAPVRAALEREGLRVGPAALDQEHEWVVRRAKLADRVLTVVGPGDELPVTPLHVQVVAELGVPVGAQQLPVRVRHRREGLDLRAILASLSAGRSDSMSSRAELRGAADAVEQHHGADLARTARTRCSTGSPTANRRGRPGPSRPCASRTSTGPAPRSSPASSPTWAGASRPGSCRRAPGPRRGPGRGPRGAAGRARSRDPRPCSTARRRPGTARSPSHGRARGVSSWTRGP